MEIRKAVSSDKNSVLKFCKNTFSWGDYISDVWDHWFSEGNLLVVIIEKTPVAICHSSFLGNEELWIEGIRVKKNLRRKGLAKNLVKHSEIIAKKNNCKISKMLIESTNENSIKLAENLNYKKETKWDFYTLLPKKNVSTNDVKFASDENKILNHINKLTSDYVKSWKLIPFSSDIISTLINEEKILILEKNETLDGLAILTDSEHFEKTLMITLVSGTSEILYKILLYIQNFAFIKNYKRIQILTKLESLPNHEGLEKKLSFFLMKKVF